MSTRSVIARPLGGTAWEGVYCHSDGYPTHTGRALYTQVRDHFHADVAAAWRDVIFAHRTGYSFLHETDPAQNICYCHTRAEGIDPHQPLIGEVAAGEMDFSYVLRTDGLAIHRWDYGLVCTVPWDYSGYIPWRGIEHCAYDMARATTAPGRAAYLLPVTPTTRTRKEIQP